MNPAMIMKLLSAKKQLETNHPKFMAFIRTAFSKPIEQDTIFEITMTRPGEAPITTNLKVLESDLELFKAMSEIIK